MSASTSTAVVERMALPRPKRTASPSRRLTGRASPSLEMCSKPFSKEKTKRQRLRSVQPCRRSRRQRPPVPLLLLLRLRRLLLLRLPTRLYRARLRQLRPGPRFRRLPARQRAQPRSRPASFHPVRSGPPLEDKHSVRRLRHRRLLAGSYLNRARNHGLCRLRRHLPLPLRPSHPQGRS